MDVKHQETIVPNPLVCTNPVTCHFVHQQLDELFTGVKQYKRNDYGNDDDYISPMVLPSSWHPKRSLAQLRSNEYYVTEKYDGVRYFLLLMSEHQTRNPQAFMVNRRGLIYPISITCKAEFFRGSLFEGELVFNRKTHKQEFYVFDVVALCGHHVHTIENGHLFGERLQWIRRIFGDKETKENHIVSNGNHYALQFFPKLFYSVETYDPVFMARNDVPNDGFIFMPNYNPIGPPQTHDQPRIWKWKPNTTIDCWLYPSDPVVYLIYKRRREPLKFVRIHGDMYLCRWIEGAVKWPNDESRYKWYIVECVVEMNQGEIVFTTARIRHDKTFPNSTKTFQQTLPTIVEPTPIDHVFSLLRPGV